MKKVKLKMGSILELHWKGDDIKNLVSKGMAYDSLTKALRTFSIYLTEVTLIGIFHPSLFCPSIAETTAITGDEMFGPSWPSLRRFRVQLYENYTPSGDQYFHVSPVLSAR